MNAATTPVRPPGTQLRIDGVNGYGLPLRPETLAGLDPFTVGHICSTLRLDEEQTSCAEAAVAAVRAGNYPVAEGSAVSIPTELRDLRQWVVWRNVDRDGATKVPLTIEDRPASTTDRATWTSYEQVCAAASGFDGIGFVFTDSPTPPYCGIDLDDCYRRRTGFDPAAARILHDLDSLRRGLAVRNRGEGDRPGRS